MLNGGSIQLANMDETYIGLTLAQIINLVFPYFQVYLMKYGYLDSSKATKSAKSAPLISSDGLKSYIEEFQAFANLTITGELDAQTVEMMGRPRCGVKDIVGHGSTREKRYALQGLLL